MKLFEKRSVFFQTQDHPHNEIMTIPLGRLFQQIKIKLANILLPLSNIFKIIRFIKQFSIYKGIY